MNRRGFVVAACLLGCRSAYAGFDPDKLIELHNVVRDKPLKKSQALMAYAQDWAKHMAETKRMYHSSMRRIMDMGFSPVAENIAVGQKDEDAVMRAWLGSWGHRRNIMNSSMDSIGVGAADVNGRLYWCTCFGKKK